MEEKMVRFLRSINIENIDDFDLDFDMISRNRFDPKKFDMMIVKNEPWSYHRLQQFMEGLGYITYPYSLTFSYVNPPMVEDVVSLFNDWYQTSYRMTSKINMRSNDNVTGHIEIVYPSDQGQIIYKDSVEEFKSLLKFINYDFVFTEVVEEEAESIIQIDDESYNRIVTEAKEDADQIIDEAREEDDETDRNDVSERIEEERKSLDLEIEEELLREMERNKREMERDRERARRNKKGGYLPIDHIKDIVDTTNNVDFTGKIYRIEVKDYPNGGNKVTLGVNDLDGAITVIFNNSGRDPNNPDGVNLAKEFVKDLKIKSNIRIRGAVYFDDYTHEITIKGHFKNILPPDEITKDDAEVKRVELHLHSTMSNQDGVTSMKDYCKYAKTLGHKAIAVTDHGVVQAFPSAQNAANEINNDLLSRIAKDIIQAKKDDRIEIDEKEAKKLAKETDEYKANYLKMIYGCEFYMIDEPLIYTKNDAEIPLNNANYVVLDLETTGLSSRYDKIMEFGAVRVERGTVISHKDILINPERKIPEKIVAITSITDDMLVDKPTIDKVLPEILDYLKDAIIVTHNASFDFNFLREASLKYGYGDLKNPVIDTLALSHYLFPSAARHNLGSLCKNMEINYDEDKAHRADYDAEVLNNVWQPMLEKLIKEHKVVTHADLARLETPLDSDIFRNIRPVYHTTVLVKNKKGLRDLYELVSLAHTKYLGKLPLIPRRELNRLRSDILIGTACLNGEIFDYARSYSKELLKKAMEFYDYVEVQPLENYSYLVNIGELEAHEIKQYVLDIIEAADELGKPVVATGDVHYLTPKEKIFRDVYINNKAVGGANHDLYPFKRVRMQHFENPDQHYRTTKEMLECFSFLGEEKAYEIVVKNTNMIADQIEAIMPAPNDYLYQPHIENCKEKLTELCFDTAHKMYGNPLPEEIETRLSKELNGVINAGYEVVYWIAHLLVKKAMEDGYIVGSRGSVGSSFLATMAGITEVNPLPPHYICPNCQHLEWGSENNPEIRSGYDLPYKECPVCGKPLSREGQNIPFETFLGFNAEKVPDIDLNFPPDYQARAHEYTKVFLGENNVFRAGTIGTCAEKTAFGLAKGYYEKLYVEKELQDPEILRQLDKKIITMKDVEDIAKEKVNKDIPRATLEYVASGCIDVRRTTGQHPGGIVVIPNDHEVYDFTPIQYPADDKTSAWKTTHFEFESIHDTLLKLDMLGHDDPMALKMMCDLTGVNLYSIPLSDPQVLSLFSSPKALKMKNDYLALKNGALALPEFGTENTRRTLETTNPKTFSDLVIISGLSHGTGVWAGNAEELIKSGVATLQNVIGCRDDIMTYLMSKGIEKGTAFAIMETVRKKDKYLKDSQVEVMKSHNIPQFYIDSCNKIEYLFPKGHATAYCMMAVRVGYFKVYYPLEFYATFFTVRSDQYDIEALVSGETAVIDKIEELRAKNRIKGEKLSNKEDEILKTLQVALEMIQRGYKFVNISLEKSMAKNFVVDKENNALIPPFSTIDGLGEHNAESVIEEREKRPFSSIEDLLSRTHLTQTNVEKLKELGVLKDLPESDQMSLFDW